MKKLLLSLVLLVSIHTVAEATSPVPKACKKIKDSCEKAGFVFGQNSKDKAGRRHCLLPLLHGAKAEGSIPLPQVSDADVENCKKKDPNYGKVTGD
ncbi:MAG: hypothetical protein EBR01_13280 [Proteobacteria bacterium]|nr:hypothetical protein [Pseudomonadota bacterium]